jgi:hypothetical protein
MISNQTQAPSLVGVLLFHRASIREQMGSPSVPSIMHEDQTSRLTAIRAHAFGASDEHGSRLASIGPIESSILPSARGDVLLLSSEDDTIDTKKTAPEKSRQRFLLETLDEVESMLNDDARLSPY